MIILRESRPTAQQEMTNQRIKYINGPGDDMVYSFSISTNEADMNTLKEEIEKVFPRSEYKYDIFTIPKDGRRRPIAAGFAFIVRMKRVNGTRQWMRHRRTPSNNISEAQTNDEQKWLTLTPDTRGISNMERPVIGRNETQDECVHLGWSGALAGAIVPARTWWRDCLKLNSSLSYVFGHCTKHILIFAYNAHCWIWASILTEDVWLQKRCRKCEPYDRINPITSWSSFSPVENASPKDLELPRQTTLHGVKGGRLQTIATSPVRQLTKNVRIEPSELSKMKTGNKKRRTGMTLRTDCCLLKATHAGAIHPQQLPMSQPRSTTTGIPSTEGDTPQSDSLRILNQPNVFLKFKQLPVPLILNSRRWIRFPHLYAWQHTIPTPSDRDVIPSPVLRPGPRLKPGARRPKPVRLPTGKKGPPHQKTQPKKTVNFKSTVTDEPEDSDHPGSSDQPERSSQPNRSGQPESTAQPLYPVLPQVDEAQAGTTSQPDDPVVPRGLDPLVQRLWAEIIPRTEKTQRNLAALWLTDLSDQLKKKQEAADQVHKSELEELEKKNATLEQQKEDELEVLKRQHAVSEQVRKAEYERALKQVEDHNINAFAREKAALAERERATRETAEKLASYIAKTTAEGLGTAPNSDQPPKGLELFSEFGKHTEEMRRIRRRAQYDRMVEEELQRKYNAGQPEAPETEQPTANISQARDIPRLEKAQRAEQQKDQTTPSKPPQRKTSQPTPSTPSHTVNLVSDSAVRAAFIALRRDVEAFSGSSALQLSVDLMAPATSAVSDLIDLESPKMQSPSTVRLSEEQKSKQSENPLSSTSSQTAESASVQPTPDLATSTPAKPNDPLANVHLSGIGVVLRPATETTAKLWDVKEYPQSQLDKELWSRCSERQRQCLVMAKVFEILFRRILRHGLRSFGLEGCVIKSGSKKFSAEEFLAALDGELERLDDVALAQWRATTVAVTSNLRRRTAELARLAAEELFSVLFPIIRFQFLENVAAVRHTVLSLCSQAIKLKMAMRRAVGAYRIEVLSDDASTWGEVAFDQLSFGFAQLFKVKDYYILEESSSGEGGGENKGKQGSKGEDKVAKGKGKEKEDPRLFCYAFGALTKLNTISMADGTKKKGKVVVQKGWKVMEGTSPDGERLVELESPTA
ncbi:hypothetical protein B0T17DRAFT_600675 [Bombardia bombarda]|uniref:Uncharacterized protein n=1 Tax=Bombardia bombarda TaxID=252184 RepID=A0AA39WUQ7_9PEZI|nr:hypothetical protein B0T17DRAFT_600675 [Bombardia bombarda]